jgi:hypothetical protein
MRGRTRVMIIAAATLVVAGVVVVWPRVREATLPANAIHDAALLPASIQLCNRSWQRDALGRTFGIVALREQTHAVPVLVETGPAAPCPKGPCTDVAQDEACATVVWVRVGSDAYMGYALKGGP